MAASSQEEERTAIMDERRASSTSEPSRVESSAPKRGSERAFGRGHSMNNMDGRQRASILNKVYGRSYTMGELSLTNMWGVCIFVIVKGWGDITSGQASFSEVFVLVYSVLMCTFNMCLQLMLVMWVRSYVVLPAVSQLQHHYQMYHEDVFPDGFSSEAWNQFPVKDEICQAVISKEHFILAMLTLWAIRMSTDLQETVHAGYVLCRVKTMAPTENTHEMIKEDNADEDFSASHIIALTPRARGLLMAIVLVPKAGIAVFLLWAGMQWLTSTEHYADLFLNVLALEFVVDVDELLYQAVYPKSFKAVVDMVTIDVQQEEGTGTTSGKNTAIMHAFFQNALYGLGVVLFVLIYYYKLQSVLPNYEFDLDQHCEQYWDDLQQLTCGMFQKDCFPKGVSSADSISD